MNVPFLGLVMASSKRLVFDVQRCELRLARPASSRNVETPARQIDPRRLDLIGILSELAEDLKTWRHGQRIGSDILSKSLKEERMNAARED